MAQAWQAGGPTAMTFPTVTADEMRAGQLLTGFVMAAFVGAYLVPGRARQIRIGALAIYLAGIAGFILWFLLR
jgi:hypothetical protein